MAYTYDSITRFMGKNDFSPEDIAYILRKDGSTILHFRDGRTLSSLIPLGLFQEFWKDADFIRVNKSVLLCSRYVVNVNRGKYLMADGTVLDGRHHGTKCHTDFMRRRIEDQMADNEETRLQSIRERFAAFDTFPIPFCVIQLVFDIYGKGTTFIFRYCNPMMADLEGLPLNKLINHSYYDIFENADEKWLVKCGSIAQNGGCRLFYDYSPEVDKQLKLLCYHVAPGFCACMLLEEGLEEKLGSLPI